MSADETLLERMRAFHGHLGPFAMLGYRAGRLALEHLQAPSHFGVSAEVRCPDHTPPSCFADGVQLGTGCTLGKRNIELIPSGRICVTVTVDEGGAEVMVVPRRAVIDRFGPWMAEADDETAARRVLSMADEELFEAPG